MLQDDPTIILEKNRYSVGDVLRGNCTTPPSDPAANITWFINGNEVGILFYFFSQFFIGHLASPLPLRSLEERERERERIQDLHNFLQYNYSA